MEQGHLYRHCPCLWAKESALAGHFMTGPKLMFAASAKETANATLSAQSQKKMKAQLLAVALTSASLVAQTTSYGLSTNLSLRRHL